MKDIILKKILVILSIVWMFLSLLGLTSLVFGVAISKMMQHESSSGMTPAAVFFIIFGFVLFILGVTLSPLFKSLSNLIDSQSK